MGPLDPFAKQSCSLLLFPTTPTEESALFDAAQSYGIEFRRFKDKPLGEYTWFGRIGRETVVAAAPERRGGRVVMGPYGPQGSAAKGIRLRELTGAEGIVALGMAFGVDPTTQQMGDVLVSQAIIPYENRIVTDDPNHPSRVLVDYSKVQREPASPSLVELFSNEAKRKHPFQVHFGAILSGAARIHSARYRDELIQQVPQGDDPIVGGDMESVGLQAASLSVNDPIWCVVKGISDFADAHRNDVIKESRPGRLRGVNRYKETI